MRRRRGKAPFQPEVVEDIMGKSGFDIRNSTPQATTLIQSEKRVENDSTFAAVNGETPAPRPPAAIPDERLDEVFATGTPGVDIVIDNRPDDDDNGDDGIIDREERDDDDETAKSAPRRKMATGLRFDELKSMMRTVNATDDATDAERLDAGRVLVEVRQTDMFEAIVSGQPVKRVNVGRLMDNFFSEWERRKREAEDPNDKPLEKAPDDFDPRKAFA